MRPRVGNDLRSLDGLLLNLFAGSQVVPASKGVAQGKLKPVARQLCPRGGEIEPRAAALVPANKKKDPPPCW